ncbi:aspartyl-phosphate phosphatase Spo0E family protein [Bacillus sp. FJAT-27245]|uniref:aspartyl-phosphate phosphatase Spo0E family protein n=1 Tax=Bacillus sp. FJAT-27245 TaxID=1684144 RepID=UPI000A97DE47|nr:aspartyl-phosphate phosphatase Spo0E family protein [Bacillus sp. FJAT-27245]
MFINNFELLQLLDEIKKKRKVMIDSANENGFTNERTIKYSQELDELIAVYQKARQTCWQPPNGAGTFVSKWPPASANIRERFVVQSAI